MPRGYRYVILAAFGWLALTGQHPSPRTEREQTKAQQSIANSLSNIATTNHDLAERAKRPPKREPCGPRNYQSDDDLCAQWKAADAAADAAWWAQWGTWFSGISTLLVLLALSLAYQANSIARETAGHQLRAWLLLDRFNLDTITTPMSVHSEVSAQIINAGQSPAKNVSISTSFRYPISLADIATHKPADWPPTAPRGVIGQGGTARGSHETVENSDDLRRGISCICRIEYRDSVSNQDRHTQFQAHIRLIQSGDRFALRWEIIGEVDAT